MCLLSLRTSNVVRYCNVLHQVKMFQTDSPQLAKSKMYQRHMYFKATSNQAMFNMRQLRFSLLILS